MASKNGGPEYAMLYKREDTTQAWGGVTEYTTRASVELMSVKANEPYGISDDPCCDLHVMGHGNARYGTALYASIVYQQVYSADLARVGQMHETLKRLSRGLDRIGQSEGWAPEWATYVGRVARILGVKRFIVKSSRAYQDMSGCRWRVMPIGEGIDHIRRDIDEWVKAHPYTEPVVEAST